MAEVFRRASNGMKVTKVAALAEETQWGLGLAAVKIAARAKAILTAHRHDGHADIDVESGSIDRFVILSDMRGLGAAMSIEFGRAPGTTSSWGPMEPVAPLRIAASIPVQSSRLRKPSGRKSQRVRSRRRRRR